MVVVGSHIDLPGQEVLEALQSVVEVVVRIGPVAGMAAERNDLAA